MKHLFKYFFSLLPCFGFSQEQQPQPSEVIDVQHYNFRIEVNDTTDRIQGVASIRAIVKKSSNVVQLDLINSGANGKGMKVIAVRSKSADLKFVHQNNKVTVTFPNTLLLNSVVDFTVVYNGIPADGLIISRNKFGDRTFFADNWPNRGRNWLPIIDHPADKSAVSWEIVSPLQYEAIANGVRIEESYLNKKQKLTRYNEEAPISTKVMVVGVARFAVEQAGVVNGIPIETWVYPQDRADGFSDFAIAVDILDFFHSHIGPYAYKKLANVQSKTMFGGLENASAIFYNEAYVTGEGTYEMTVAHEVAHQWFGDAASEKDWPHVWLSEGFATYFAILFAEHRYGDDRRKYELTNDRKAVLDYYKSDQSPIVKTNEPDPMKLLTANSYQKAGWVLHMLRRELGDNLFWNGVRQYYREYMNGNAVTADFQRVMESVSGKSLEAFFQQWLYKAGHPILEWDWAANSTSSLRINVRQLQKEGAFQFPMEVAVFTSDSSLPTIHKVSISKETESFELKTSSKPLKIELDPNINLLFDAKLKN